MIEFITRATLRSLQEALLAKALCLGVVTFVAAGLSSTVPVYQLSGPLSISAEVATPREPTPEFPLVIISDDYEEPGTVDTQRNFPLRI